jgi:hypothetical protein
MEMARQAHDRDLASKALFLSRLIQIEVVRSIAFATFTISGRLPGKTYR